MIRFNGSIHLLPPTKIKQQESTHLSLLSRKNYPLIKMLRNQSLNVCQEVEQIVQRFVPLELRQELESQWN